MEKTFNFMELSVKSKYVAIKEFMIDDVSFFCEFDLGEKPMTFIKAYETLKDESTWKNHEFYEDGIIVGGMY